jgi:hypothetical protein
MVTGLIVAINLSALDTLERHGLKFSLSKLVDFVTLVILVTDGTLRGNFYLVHDAASTKWSATVITLFRLIMKD